MDRTIKAATNINDLISDYEKTSSGHFFDKSTMKFFKSKITSEFRRLSDSECLFITSERFENNSRNYTLRKAAYNSTIREDKDIVTKIIIKTIGDFNCMTLNRAKKEIMKL